MERVEFCAVLRALAVDALCGFHTKQRRNKAAKALAPVDGLIAPKAHQGHWRFAPKLPSLQRLCVFVSLLLCVNLPFAPTKTDISGTV